MPPSSMPFVPPGLPEKGHRISEKYVLGAQIGKGAFGTVYECQNQETGEIVAVKRVPLRNLTPEQLKSLEQEIEVLKILNHPNIVKYIATVRTRNHVHIVLQYMENGSLAQNIKKFGVFPPPLVALFTRQVLQGLAYLHDQGVIHRDIKGANILSDKSGRVKLADFGVAVRTRGSSANNSDSVVGTPYWMAPEIIDMLAPTSACDIWSVGCTVIELLTSKPPYADVPTAAAMYRIVQSPTVPLPENISPEIANFLNLCFIKQPSSRPTAHELLEHEWIKSSIGSTEIRASAQLSSLARDIDSSQGTENDDNPATSPGGLARNALSQRQKLGSITSAQSRSSVSSHGSNPIGRHRHSLPGQVYDSISFDQDTGVPGTANVGASNLLATDHSSWRLSNAQPLSAVGEHDHEDWDKEMGINTQQDFQQQGILWSGRSQRVQKDEMTRPRSMRGIEQMAQRRAVQGAPLAEENITGQRSPLLGPSVTVVEGDSELERAFEGDRDVTSVNSPSTRPTGSAVARKKKGLRLAKFRESADDADFGDLAGDDLRKQAGLLVTNLGKRKQQESESSDEEDPSDGFTSPDPLGPGVETGRAVRARKAAEVQELIGKLKLSGTEGTQASVVVNAADKLVEMFQETPALKRTLLTHHGVTPLLETLSRAGDEEGRAILRILIEVADNDRNFQEFLTMAGIVPLLTKLAGRESPLETRRLAGDLVSHFLCTSAVTLHMFVACGGLSTLVALLDSKGEGAPTVELAVIAVDGVQRIFAETVAPPGSHRRASIARAAAQAEARANGMIVGVPKNDFCLLFAKTPLLDRLAALGNRLQTEEGKRECSKCGVAPVGVLAEVCHIFVIFSQGGPQAKKHLAECSKALRFILSTIVTRWASAAGTNDAVLEDDVDDDIDTVKTLLNCIKNLASESGCLYELDSAGVVQALVPFLALRQEPVVNDSYLRQKLRKRRAIPAVAAAISEVHNMTMLILFYMLRLSPARQERAAVCGIIPLAKSAVVDRTTVKTFAMQILVDMAHTSDFTRHCLFRDGALEFFLDVLRSDEPFWQERALQAIEQFLLPRAPAATASKATSPKANPPPSASSSQDSSDRRANGEMERVLLTPYALRSFVELFQLARSEYFESTAKILLSMLEASPKLAEAISRSEVFVAEITARLSYPKAEVRINLLKLLSIISRSHTDLETMLLEHNLPAIITSLSKSSKAAKLVVVATHADNLLSMWRVHLESKHG